MCRSRAEGGQRCYTHARKAFDKAFMTYAAALARGDSAIVAQSLERATSAGVVLASTQEGADLLRLRSAAMAHSLPERAGWYDSMVRQGEAQREMNGAVLTAVRSSPGRQVRALAEHLHLR